MRLNPSPPTTPRSDDNRNIDRRSFIRLAAASAAAAAASHHVLGAGDATPGATPAGESGPVMARFPEKTDLILLTERPPQLETPLKYFKDAITPNDAFFVRWHLSGIPTTVDLDTFRLAIGGHVEQELSLSIADLKKDFEPVTITAVNQCSGNSRSFFAPRVPGGQWANGAVGNAKWTGVRLKDLLAKAKVKDGAVDVSFAGLDRPPMPTTPAFVKSLSVKQCNEPDILVAYEMNGTAMPMLNGFPIRLIVPGWFATYWVKALSHINVLPEKFSGFWMDKAYRVPNNERADENPKDLAKDTVPINKMYVRTIIASPEPGARVAVAQPIEVAGVAFDGGSGIARVEVSADGGKTWSAAKLGPDLGKYSFRAWTYAWKPSGAGPMKLLARATSNAGETQPATPKWNRSGYARNLIEGVEVTVG